MKIAYVYGPFCLGGSDTSGDHVVGFNFADLWNDPRGLTGSELSFFKIAKETALRGHDVHMFTFGRDGSVPPSWEGVTVHPFSELGPATSEPGAFDAVYSWNEAEVLRRVPGGQSGPLRMCNLQINDFVHCRPGFGDIVDVWTSPSESHRQMVLSKKAHPIHLRPGDTAYAYVPNPSRWDVLTNGCEPSAYASLYAAGVKKVPGRVIWGSSPDRGLHLLLQEWPKIRRAAPHAHLKIFYKVMKWADNIVAHPFGDPTIQEQIRRAYYIKEALRRLSSHGVELVDSVSRNQIDFEMAEAEVLAYSCHPVSWTEGFSVTLMEGCAAGSFPVTTAVDALPEIYGSCVPMVPVPVTDHMSAFSDFVIRGLTDPAYREDVNVKVKDLASRYTWASLAERAEQIITKHLVRKRSGE